MNPPNHFARSQQQHFCWKQATLLAFTLTELLVVISIIAVLAALIFPVMASVSARSHTIKCQNNLKQLQSAWILYASENDSALVSAGGWCPGKMAQASDRTNAALLEESPLWKYIRNAAVFKCPGDKSENVRSYGVNNHMNGLSFDGQGTVFRRLATIPRPSQFFVFVDEDNKTINDALFRVDVGQDSATGDVVAKYHTGGSALSFADGHIELHQWTGDRAKDAAWLKEHATETE